MAALAIMMGEGERLLTTGIALMAHECAHILAAGWMGTDEMELELLPFGGAARLPDLWLLRPGQTILVSLAGPAVNLLAALALSAGFWWGVPVSSFAVRFLESNLMLLLFNLLPALPLDGGRIFCALLGRVMTPERACRWGVWAGGILAGVLALVSLAVRKINLTILLAAVFLILSGFKEQKGARGAAIRSLHLRAGELTREGVLPLRMLAVCENTPLFRVLRQMRPRQAHMLLVIGESGNVRGVVSEEELRRALEKGENLPAGRMIDGKFGDMLRI